MTEASRRAFLGAALAAPAILSGCAKPDDWRSRVEGRWIGDNSALGHRVRDARGAQPAGARERRCDVLVVGSGIAGLSAARTLQRLGVTDFAVLELEDAPGGNSRGHAMQGLRCPLGAHYLPLPGPFSGDIQDWLVEIGLAKATAGGLKWDERHLCHSPQERLFINGRWQDGMLPNVARNSPTQAQYQRFAKAVADAGPVPQARQGHRRHGPARLRAAHRARPVDARARRARRRPRRSVAARAGPGRPSAAGLPRLLLP